METKHKEIAALSDRNKALCAENDELKERLRDALAVQGELAKIIWECEFPWRHKCEDCRADHEETALRCTECVLAEARRRSKDEGKQV